jgi:hypothetical protein
MTFQPGQSGNPSGRVPGSKNKLNRDFHEAYEEAKARGYKHPFLAMMEIANDMTQPVERRDGMLREAASYVCPKPKQTIAVEQEVPTFTTAEQAEAFLAEFISTMAPDLEPEQIATMTRQFILSKREGRELELKSIAAGKTVEPMHVIIDGGLPIMPGHENLIMPGMNGKEINGTAIIEHRSDPPIEPISPPENSSPEEPPS